MTPGHEKLACEECHRPAAGSFRQQAQAYTAYLMGDRASHAGLVSLPVDDNSCQGCHDRPTDRHPVYRFLEPRFAAARDSIHPESCMSCHHEHEGERFRLLRIGDGFCRHCHQDTEVKDDPLDVPHEKLFREGRWTTCLTCHDFHGNHDMDVPVRLKEAYNLKDVRSYLLDGPSPYGTKILQAPDALYTKE
jgi:predicted CXXCH cytochrome family protein